MDLPDPGIELGSPALQAGSLLTELMRDALLTAKSLQSCPTLCNPIDGCPPGSPVPGILQARILEWGAIAFSNAWKWKMKVKSCLTLSDPMDCSPPGSSIHGIFRARVLEWVPLPSPSEDTTNGFWWMLWFYERTISSLLTLGQILKM